MTGKKERWLYQQGYIFVGGWVPAEFGETVLTQIDAHRVKVQNILLAMPRARKRSAKAAAGPRPNPARRNTRLHLF